MPSRTDVFELFNEAVAFAFESTTLRNCGDVAQAEAAAERALQLFDTVLEVDSAHLGAMGGKASLLADLGRFCDAAEVFDKVIECDPQWHTAHWQRAICLIDAGDLLSARESVLRAVAIEGTARFAADVSFKLDMKAQEYLAQARLVPADQFTELMDIHCFVGSLLTIAVEVDSANLGAVQRLHSVDAIIRQLASQD